MAKKRKAAGDAPGTSRSHAQLKATAKEDEEVYLDTSLLSGGARGSDGERGRVVVVPHPPPPKQPQAQLVAAGRDANPVAQRREERDLLADLGARQVERDFALGFLHGRMAAAAPASSAAVGEEEEVASSWKNVPPSTQGSPSGKRKEPAAAAQAQPPPHADQHAVAAAAAAQARPQRPTSGAGAAVAI